MNDPAENWRGELAELRQAMFLLHKSLLDAERLSYETENGPIKSNGEYLQLLIHNERFRWLGPYTRLVVQYDETLESREEVAADAIDRLWDQTRAVTIDQSQLPDSRYSRVLAVSPQAQSAAAEVAKLHKKQKERRA